MQFFFTIIKIHEFAQKYAAQFFSFITYMKLSATPPKCLQLAIQKLVNHLPCPFIKIKYLLSCCNIFRAHSLTSLMADLNQDK